MNLFLLLAEESSSSVTPPSTGSGWQGWAIIIGLAVILVLMYVLNGRRAKKEREAADKKIASLQPGVNVKTIGLICGEVYEVGENTVVLKTGSEENFSYITVDKRAIYEIATAPETTEDDTFTEVPVKAENTEEPFEEVSTETADEKTTDETAE